MMLTYAISLFILAIMLVILDFFLPSSGILSIFAACAALTSIVLAFIMNDFVGIMFLIMAVVLTPTLFHIGLKLFPKTPIGKRICLSPGGETPRQRGNAGIAEVDYTQLIGKIGTTITQLRPSGIVKIDDEQYSAVTQGSIIEKKQSIKVINVQGNSVVVEAKENS